MIVLSCKYVKVCVGIRAVDLVVTLSMIIYGSAYRRVVTREEGWFSKDVTRSSRQCDEMRSSCDEDRSVMGCTED